MTIERYITDLPWVRDPSHKGSPYLINGSSAYKNRGELCENFNILHIISDDKSLEYHIPLELYFNPVPKAITPSFVKDIVERSLKVTQDKN